MAAQYSANATLAAVVQQLGAHLLLSMDDEEDRQALALLEHATAPELVLGVIDREGGVAAVVIEREGIAKLRDALTGWLDR
jgi:hypothetical protein